MASDHTFGIVRSANDGGLLPKDVCVFRCILHVGAEQSVWESVGVGEILGRAIEAKDIETMRVFLVAIVMGVEVSRSLLSLKPLLKYLTASGFSLRFTFGSSQTFFLSM